MATTPDRLKAEADQTREKLAADVDRLANRTSPKRKLQQGSERIRGAARNAKERVMGTTDDEGQDGVRGVAETTREKTVQATETVRSLPRQALRKAEGNPLAVGLIAFGAGLLAAALIPESRAEQRAAAPIAGAARESAAHVADEAKDAARDAGQRVAEAAKESAAHVADEAKDAAREPGRRTTERATETDQEAARTTDPESRPTPPPPRPV